MGQNAPAPATCRPRRVDKKEMHAAESPIAKATLASTASTVGGGSMDKKRGQDERLKGGGGVGSVSLAAGVLSAPARVSAAHTVEARSGDSSNAEASAYYLCTGQ
jgi:hypothetical protein